MVISEARESVLARTLLDPALDALGWTFGRDQRAQIDRDDLHTLVLWCLYELQDRGLLALGPDESEEERAWPLNS